MNCVNCGSPLEDDAAFCTSCGARVQPESRIEEHEKVPEKSSSNKKMVFGVCAAIAIVVLILSALLFSSMSKHPADDSESSAATSEVQDASEEGGYSDASAPEDEPEESVAQETPLVFQGIEKTSASTTLPTGGVNTKSYSSDNLIDSNPASCWCEGSSGDGSGEYAILSGKEMQRFSGFKIWNGYQGSDHLYEINARPRTICVYADDKLIDIFKLKDQGLGSQRIEFDEPVDAVSLRIEIMDVYEGTKYEDCCISEIECF